MRIAKRATCAAAAALIAAAGIASAAHAAKPFYGVVTQTEFGAQEYDLMQAAGVQSMRGQFGWPEVQRQEGRCQASAQVGVCDWRRYDRVIGALASRGIEFFPYLLNVPSWIAKDPNRPPVRSPQARKAWSAWVEAAVKRYGRGGVFWETVYPVDHPLADPVPVRRWQIWNEPSAEPFWKPRPKTREYAKLVKITSKAIRSVDRRAYIVLAGLFGTPTVGIDQPKFIRGIYRVRKIERYFDAVAIHPYGPDLDRVKFQVDWARDEMRRAGDRKADLWISEIGWASDRSHKQLGVGRKGQARMLKRSFKLFRRKRSKWNIGAVYWYAWQDVDADGFCDFCRHSGLIDLQKQPKPSYEAFREQATR